MKKNNYKKKIYITGGILKGRFIKLSKYTNTKPTGVRIKITLFNWLKNHIQFSKCLDCFAGSGSLSIESISRLASSVTTVENNIYLIKIIKKLLNKFSITSIQLFHKNILNVLNKQGSPYDIIYLDPPFIKKILLQKTIELLEKKKWIHTGSIIYLEENKYNKQQNLPKRWRCIKKKIMGSVQFSLFYISNI